VAAQLIQHLLLPGVVLADREGHHLVEVEVARPVEAHQDRADGAQPKPLAHHLGRNAEPGADFFARETPLLREPPERLELVGRVHARPCDVLVQANLMRIIRQVHDTADGVGLPDLLALGAQQQREAAPLPDGDEIAAGRRARLVRFGLHHRSLEDTLHGDASGQGLDVGLGVGGPPRIARRLLQPVERDFDDVAVLVNDLDLLGHGKTPWGMGCRRKARLRPCPSARPGVQAEGRLRGEPAAGL